MKIREIKMRIVKIKRKNEPGTSRLRMAAAFMAGMLLMAALSQTPVVDDIFASLISQEATLPSLPDAPDSPKPGGSPDASNPVKPIMSELVYNFAEEAVPTC
jgi:hypothetical protein